MTDAMLFHLVVGNLTVSWRLNDKSRGYCWNATCLEVRCNGDQAQSLVPSSRHHELHPMSNNLCSCSRKEFLDMTELLGLLHRNNYKKHQD
ncbi:hypothetical protein H5410_000295 [Solanum commersonii]|uniref:Uncharacterized protein n=1 Tax=Solanum commersonii TaxID=4109 RepID=A0A9J6AWE5_SOLCO|nr:hypothetical protein H5410_000295 [Solanum commersonii]